MENYIRNNTHAEWSKELYFQEFLLPWIPCSFLFLTFPLHFISTSKLKKSAFSKTMLYLSKMISSACLIIMLLIDMGCISSSNVLNQSHFVLSILQPIILITSEIMATILFTLDKWHERKVNVLLFIYRILMELLLSSIFQLSAKCLLWSADEGPHLKECGCHRHCDLKCFSVVMVTLLINTILLILQSCFTDSNPPLNTDKRTSPENSASLLSLLTFSWFSRFVYYAGKTKLGYSDVWNLKEVNKSAHVSRQFHQRWFQIYERRCQNFSTASSNGVVTTTVQKDLLDDIFTLDLTSDERLLNSESKVIGGRHECHDPTNQSLLRVLYKMLRGSFAVGVCLNVVHDVFMFASPFIFKQVICYLMDDEAPLSRGLIVVALLFVCSCVQVVLRHQYTFKYNVIGLRVQSVLLSAIYKKSLLLNSPSLDDVGMGEVVNLMSVDVQKVVDMVSMVNYLWSCPIQLAICTYLLWELLGYSVLAGFVVTLCMLPMNAWVAKKCKKFQINQMKFKDARIKLLDEIINGIKVIKLYAWEAIFKGRVSKVRDDELKVIRRAAYLTAVATFAWSSTPFLISLSTFGLYLLSSNENVLTVEKAFVSLTLFNILRTPLSMLPMFITNIAVTKVSVKRLQRFLNLDEIKQVQRSPQGHSKTTSLNEPEHPLHAVRIKDATIGWGRSRDPNVILSRINLVIPRGNLVAVVGGVGGGKSTLLSAIIGEARLFEGECQTMGSISYSSQQAWLQNKTVKENILFGEKMDELKYSKVLEGCALMSDLQELADGDETVVGDRGVTLSGGQKQRVSMARSIYSEADVYIFDDPLASVDMVVANHLFERVLSNNDGIIKDKTRIIATNSISFLPSVDLIIIIYDGRISGVGSYESLLLSNKEFQMFSQNYISNINNNHSKIPRKQSGMSVSASNDKLSSPSSHRSSSNLLLPHQKHQKHFSDLSHCKSCFEINLNRKQLDDGGFSRSLLHRLSNLTKSEMLMEEILLESAKSVNSRSDFSQKPNERPDEKRQMLNDEEVKKDRVSWKVFLSYLRSIGAPICVLAFFFIIINNLLSVVTNIWLSKWTSNARVYNSTSEVSINVTHGVDGDDDDTQSYLGLYVYAALGFCYIFTLLLRSALATLACSRASKVMNSDLINSLLSVPLTFYDLTPKGRIINRASNDVATLDYVMPFTVSGFFNILIMCLLSFGIIAINIPLFLVPLVVLLVVYVLLQRYFVSTSQQLRRMSSNLRSHVYSHIGETLQGLPTIRSFGASARFVEDMFRKVDDVQEVCYLTHVSQRWLGTWLEFIGIVLVSMVAMLAVIGKNQMDVGMAALCLSYAFDIIQNLNFLVTMICELESNLVSIERIKEYSDLDGEESKRDYPSYLPSSSWPSDGRIELKEYSSRYRSDTDLVLKKLSMSIEAGEKIGIVGRTGSGKSSVCMSLFRFLEAVEGSILVDEVNIMHVPLKNLRSSITLVPQEPVIFSDSIRFNMDPSGVCSDEELWNSLAETDLKNHISELPCQLDHECGSNGGTLSFGQLQLLCLSRALLRKSKILLLDEATASIDVETEDSIKKCLEMKFLSKSHEVASYSHSMSGSFGSGQHEDNMMIRGGAGDKCTLIIIAHRIRTVLNCDRIFLLENGRLTEFGEPKSLLASSDSRFYKLCNNCN